MNHLVIMAKAPKAGSVKTRLAGSIGVAEATRTYRTILNSTLRRLGRDPRWRTWIAVAPDTAIAQRVWPRGVCLTPQGSGDLGMRMQRVFDQLPGGPVVIIGTDIPDIPAASVAHAFGALGSYDCVIGPAPDGGYWLIGQRRRPRVLNIFEDVRWSGPHARADTLSNMARQNVATLEERDDVDTVSDYLAWRRNGL
ncbi:MAG: TIGR04282 family arsenosugar biosynthesis glycosyltransferase [Pseudomonadota bacterium]